VFFLNNIIDIADDVALCHLDLVDACQRQRCRKQHPSSTLPYIWQAKLWGEWKALHHQDTIEESFCDKDDDLQLSVRLYFYF